MLSNLKMQYRNERLERTNAKMSDLTLAQANAIVTGALIKARAWGYKPMAVAVLDAAGNLKVFANEDGASMFRFEIARAKAWGSVGMGVSSRVLAERAKENPSFFISLASTAGGRFLPQTGAVVIRDTDGSLLGAVGASGGTGDEDERICIAGVSEAGLVST
ncbi:hypothetical protein D3C87_659990 [compost metagenome]|nr:hypothetical protein BKP43_01630 [Variovorax boronicumulans]